MGLGLIRLGERKLLEAILRVRSKAKSHNNSSVN